MAKEETNVRWLKWDTWINEEKYEDVVKEFDELLRKKKNVLVGDLIRRDDALEAMGVASLSPNAMHKRKTNGKPKKSKP